MEALRSKSSEACDVCWLCRSGCVVVLNDCWNMVELEDEPSGVMPESLKEGTLNGYDGAPPAMG